MWSGDDPGRAPEPPLLAAGPPPVLGRVRAAGSPGLTLAQIEHRVDGPRDEIRVAVLAVLWSGTWKTDLSTRLSAQSVVHLTESTS